jgi:hypothetical protein
MRLILCCLLAIVVVTSVPGCVCSITEDKEDAERTMNTVFECIRYKDYQSTLQYYSDDFFEKTSRDQWVAMLEAVDEKLGDLDSWQLEGWKTTKLTGTNPGTYVELTYQTKYSKYDATETVTLKRTGAEFRVFGDHYDSHSFLATDNSAMSTM